MGDSSNEMIAVCGLDCSSCDIRLATTDENLAKKVAEWFKKDLNEEIRPEDIYCFGCKGDRKKHWSPDCWILKCCVDERGLDFCYECENFACERLEEWAKQNEGYGNALARLRRLKETA